MTCPKIIISEYNQTYHTSPSCYYILDLLCVKIKEMEAAEIEWGIQITD